MKILFWNLKDNANEKWVSNLISANNVDIALFAEYHSTSFDKVFKKLPHYLQYDGFGACDKITLVCKDNISTAVKREQNRYTLYSCVIEDCLYNIAGIHLPAPPSSDSNSRKNIIRNIVQDVCEQEKNLQNRMTIIIGDFNCNPFDEEVVQKDAFNAVLYKPLINKQEVIVFNEKRQRRFYNPLMHYISESTQTYGSFYYSSGSAPIYWNCFDQILVRKELIDNIESLEYIKSINGKQLMTDTRPNCLISDHLPLLVELRKR